MLVAVAWGAESPSRSRDGSIEASLREDAPPHPRPGLRRVRATAPLKRLDRWLRGLGGLRLRRVRATAPLKPRGIDAREQCIPRLRRVRATAPLKHDGPYLILTKLIKSLRRVRATAPLKPDRGEDLGGDPALVSVAFARRLH